MRRHRANVDHLQQIVSSAPAWTPPVDWWDDCEYVGSMPVRSSQCVWDFALHLQASLDGGTSWTSPLTVTYGWVRPLKLAFLFNGPIVDFGWTCAHSPLTEPLVVPAALTSSHYSCSCSAHAQMPQTKVDCFCSPSTATLLMRHILLRMSPKASILLRSTRAAPLRPGLP